MKLVLNGSNTIVGGAGYAGIYVAKDAILTISSDTEGSLIVRGGDGGAVSGAGIGGNAFNKSGDPGFGTIVIESGTVTAYGGIASSAGAAGIGSGGVKDSDSELLIEGTIQITGGKVVAYGGYDSPSGYAGGAGLQADAERGGGALLPVPAHGQKDYSGSVDIL